MIDSQNFPINNRCYLLVCPLAFCCNIYFWFSFSFFFWRLAERKQTLCILLMLNCKEKKRKDQARDQELESKMSSYICVEKIYRKVFKIDYQRLCRNRYLWETLPRYQRVQQIIVVFTTFIVLLEKYIVLAYRMWLFFWPFYCTSV
jgi:hypothetical protein